MDDVEVKVVGTTMDQSSVVPPMPPIPLDPPPTPSMVPEIEAFQKAYGELQKAGYRVEYNLKVDPYIVPIKK